MKKRVFLADRRKGVEALGIELDAKPEQIHVYINGVDITENLLIDTIEVVIETAGES